MSGLEFLLAGTLGAALPLLLAALGEMVVENRMVFHDGRLHIFGSSSKNSYGHFIRWEETLEPMA